MCDDAQESMCELAPFWEILELRMDKTTLVNFVDKNANWKAENNPSKHFHLPFSGSLPEQSRVLPLTQILNPFYRLLLIGIGFAYLESCSK